MEARTHIGARGLLFTNAVIGISPLANLATLVDLNIHAQDISGLTNLMQFDLRFNPELSNVQALFENSGIGAGDIVELRHTNVSCTDQERLAEKGVEIRTEIFFLPHRYQTEIKILGGFPQLGPKKTTMNITNIQILVTTSLPIPLAYIVPTDSTI